MLEHLIPLIASFANPDWLELAIEDYKKYNDELSKTASAHITDHKAIGEGVYLTTYSNGDSVIVNYNDYSVKYKNTIVDALSWGKLSIG